MFTKEFESLVADIQHEYSRLGHSMGWRFLTSPKATLDNPKVVLVTLNPAGNRIDEHPAESQEQGSAYVVESWDGQPIGQDKLQRQVQMLFRSLDVKPDEVLSAHFCPFRSPSLKKLHRQTESLEFSELLWTRLLAEISPELVVCLNRDTQTALRNIMGPTMDLRSMPTGWGNYEADVETMANGTRLLRLPHLSRFSLFGSVKRRPYLNSIMSLANGEPAHL